MHASSVLVAMSLCVMHPPTQYVNLFLYVLPIVPVQARTICVLGEDRSRLERSSEAFSPRTKLGVLACTKGRPKKWGDMNHNYVWSGNAHCVSGPGEQGPKTNQDPFKNQGNGCTQNVGAQMRGLLQITLSSSHRLMAQASGPRSNISPKGHSQNGLCARLLAHTAAD